MAHILIIDDDKDLVTANKVALEQRGHKVSTAYTVDEGWKLLETGNPDAVVLDVMMEHFTSGFELAQDIGAKYPKLPVVMLTGVHEHMSSAWNFSEKDQDWLPVRKFLEKPVPAKKLAAEVEAALAENR